MIPIFEIFQNISIIQIGCGGTGGWLVPNVSKFLNNMLTRVDLNFKGNKRINYLLVDNDTVELRNVVRQNFQDYEETQNKARSLAMRYAVNYLQIKYSSQQFDKNNIEVKDLLTQTFMETEYGEKSLVLLLGCVDHIETRLNIYKLFSKIEKKYFDHLKCIYMDSGNNLYNGQLYTCWSKKFPEDIKNHNKGHKKFMDLYKKMIGDEGETQSCAFFGEQSQSINNLASTILFCQIQNIIINCELPPSLIQFNSMGYSTYKI